MGWTSRKCAGHHSIPIPSEDSKHVAGIYVCPDLGWPRRLVPSLLPRKSGYRTLIPIRKYDTAQWWFIHSVLFKVVLLEIKSSRKKNDLLWPLVTKRIIMSEPRVGFECQERSAEHKKNESVSHCDLSDGQQRAAASAGRDVKRYRLQCRGL